MSRTYGKAQDLIDFTRASSGTALRRVKYGAELVTNGTFDTDSDWSKQTGWSIGSGVASFSGGGGASILQNAGLEAGKVYAITFDITSITSGGFIARCGFDNASQTFSTTGTHTVNLVCGSNAFIYISSVGATTGSVDNVSVKEVTFDTSDGDLILFNHPANIPRIEYDANGNLLGLLVEESRVNSISYTDFSSGWGETTFSGISSSGLRYLQLNAGIAPDGTNTAVKVYASTNSDQQRLYFSVGLANAQYTFSVYAKAAEYTTIAIRHDTGNGESISIDLTDGSLIGTTTPEAYSITDAGNGWYRISITDTDTDSSGVPWVQLLNDLGAETFAGDGVSGVYIWGPQAEAGSFPTSYIPTSGSTATRSADVASIGVDGFGYRQDEGSVVVEAISNDAEARFFSLDDTTFSNRIHMRTNVDGGGIRTFVNTGGTSYTNVTAGTYNFGDSVKLSLAFKQNDLASYADGTQLTTDSTVEVPPVTQLQIGKGIYTPPLNGHIKSIKYYPRRLTNDQLVELTS